MPRGRPFATPLAVLLATVAAAPAPGQGTVIIDHPIRHPRWPRRVTTTPLYLKYQRVYADISDGAAVTRVHQTFRNPTGRRIEGTYVFPLPDDVAVGDFVISAGGKMLRGEVLDAESARRRYEQIVRRARDPALLEFLGKRLWQAKIFPIPPGGELDVKLRYSQMLREQGGLGLYRHPLRAETVANPTIDQTVVQVRLKSTLPLASVFCPSHKCDILRPNDHEATVTFEQSHARPQRDFLLYYQRKDAAFGLSLLTHRAAADAGYFLIRLSPRIELPGRQVLPKDIAFVIDTSGSMQGGKIEQVKQALEFCVNALSAQDRFNIYSFATEVHPFRDALLPASAEAKRAAVEFAGQMQALGGTNINRALLAALQADPHDPTRPYLIVFMTDGEPTVDVTDPNQILENVRRKNGNVRFHVLGVGTKVNTHLLDKLAEATRGTRDYCTENEDLELKLSALVSRLANPVLTDIALNISGLKTFDVYPRQLPDLFRGNDLVVLGRYEGSGTHAVELTGRMREQTRKLTYEGHFPQREPANDFLPVLWAGRKVAYLLDQIRLHGQTRELKDEVIRLATRYGIVTPYTSALILEDDTPIAALPPAFRAQQRAMRQAAEEARRARPRAGAGLRRAAGRPAVAAARRLYLDQQADSVQDAPADILYRPGVRQAVRQVIDRGFTFDERHQRWVDARYDGTQQVTRLVAFSDEYFRLLREKPFLRRYLAIGPQVLVVVNGQAYETVAPAGGS